MKPDKHVKINIALRPEMLRQIDRRAWELHMTRSAFLCYAARKAMGLSAHLPKEPE